MGTWGPGVFDSDYALDLMVELCGGESVEPLMRVLREAANTDVSSPEAQEAVAAAAIISASFGNSYGIAPEVAAWVAEHAGIVGTQGSAFLALAALARVVRPGSDLCGSWVREDAREEYFAGVSRLQRELELAKVLVW